MEHKTTDVPLRVLRMLRLYEEERSKKVLIFGFLYCILMLYVIILGSIQFPNIVANISKVVDNVEVVLGTSQILIKVFLFVLQYDKFHKILITTKYFWTVNICSAAYKVKLHAVIWNTVRLQKLFLYCVTASAFMVDLNVFTQKRLPLGAWTIAGHEMLRKSFIVAQMFSIPIAGIFVTAFDSLFLAFSIQTIVQFRILRYCLKNLKVSNIKLKKDAVEYYSQLTLYIQHHSFLLVFLQSVQEYFAGGMLMEYLTIGLLICTEMYAFLESDNFQSIMKHSVTCAGMMFQLVFYCFTAHMVSSEALMVSYAIYNSDWYSKHDPNLKHPVILLIQRSQQQFTFTAGGLVEMNMATLVGVLRASYSFCTVMRRLKRAN